VLHLLQVMEYLSLGSLHKFIRKNGLKVRLIHRAHFCWDAAKGMRYLEQKKCIHRWHTCGRWSTCCSDVAARNCLLAEDCTVKIADFGLSRPELNYKATGGKVPVKWLAPECLTAGLYSSLSAHHISAQCILLSFVIW